MRHFAFEVEGASLFDGTIIEIVQKRRLKLLYHVLLIPFMYSGTK